MDRGQLLTKKRVIIGATLLAVLLAVGAYTIFGHSPNKAVDPSKDELLSLEDGTILYHAGNFYRSLGENDDTFSMAEKDIVFFGRTTRPEFKDPNTTVSFTFDKKISKQGNTSIFTGTYFGLDDKIEIRLTAHDRGVYTLSITNLKDKTNIDDQLSMNGKRNIFIRTLPVQKGHFSIRYQQPFDRIVVTFYDGYAAKDVDEATTMIRTALGNAESQDVVYTINRIGEVSLEQARQNLTTPLPQP